MFAATDEKSAGAAAANAIITLETLSRINTGLNPAAQFLVHEKDQEIANLIYTETISLAFINALVLWGAPKFDRQKIINLIKILIKFPDVLKNVDRMLLSENILTEVLSVIMPGPLANKCLHNQSILKVLEKIHFRYLIELLSINDPFDQMQILFEHLDILMGLDSNRIEVIKALLSLDRQKFLVCIQDTEIRKAVTRNQVMPRRIIEMQFFIQENHQALVRLLTCPKDFMTNLNPVLTEISRDRSRYYEREEKILSGFLRSPHQSIQALTQYHDPDRNLGKWNTLTDAHALVFSYHHSAFLDSCFTIFDEVLHCFVSSALSEFFLPELIRLIKEYAQWNAISSEKQEQKLNHAYVIHRFFNYNEHPKHSVLIQALKFFKDQDAKDNNDFEHYVKIIECLVDDKEKELEKHMQEKNDGWQMFIRDYPNIIKPLGGYKYFPQMDSKDYSPREWRELQHLELRGLKSFVYSPEFETFPGAIQFRVKSVLKITDEQNLWYVPANREKLERSQ